MDSEFACPLCPHVSKTIKGYVTHSQLHSNEYRQLFKCPLKGCNRKLSSYTGIRTHIYRDHQSKIRNKSHDKLAAININVKLRCKAPLCHHVCDGMNDLFKHLRKHIDEATSVQCPFDQCSKNFSTKKSFSSHISRYHRNNIVNDLPTGVVCSSNSDIFDTGISSILEDSSLYTENYICDLEDTGGEELQTEEEDALFMRNLALFYLKLLSKFLLPASVVQYILEEFQNIHNLGFSYCLQNLNSSLKQLNVPEHKIKEIISSIKESDYFSKCNSGPLRSDHTRNVYFKEKFNHVQPQCYHMGKNNQNKSTFQYVPILETLKCLFKDESVLKEYNLMTVHQDRDITGSKCCFSDIDDGLSFQTNELFKSETNSLSLILYQDAFEICNPLGSSKKKHKIVGVYMTLGNFRPHIRSVVDNTLLVLLCKEVDLKHFGYDKIFSKLVEDLKELENNGIQINNDILKGTLYCITGDNLGSHGIGGFTENFSTVEYFCRYCNITLKEFHADPTCVGAVRTVEDYELALKQLEDENTARSLNNVKGIKFNSPFNVLKYYHVCKAGLPPCLGHDIFEGVGDYDVALILKNLVNEKGWLTYAELNQCIIMFPYCGTDAASKPCQVNTAGTKLGGQATQNWCLIRLLPVILYDKIVDAHDPVWQLFLLLCNITEIICAPKIEDSDLAYLAILIDEYLEDRQKIFPNDKLRPKHHFLKHYPNLILLFGPLIRLWTLRFESKHCYFKRCIKSANNFKNVCQTMSEKHQLLQAYKQASSYFPSDIEAVRSISLISDTYSPDIKKALKMCQITEGAEVSLEVTIKGTLYRKGHYVVLSKCEQGLSLGEIQFIILNSCTQAYFLVKEFTAQLSQELQVYTVLYTSPCSSFQCIESSKLLDYYPLTAYKRGKLLLISLKHNISAKNFQEN